MHNDSPSKNLLIAAAASRSWIARAGTERKAWPHQYWHSGAAKLQSGALPQGGWDSSLEASPARAQAAHEQELR